ncbi:MAG: hypothetical protein B7X11_00360 [Acidobacteria bacterium 37-65-4]|nr:MAG: hypothetical protein B7X11_00360 [Acidobacteria bacterium 37-65-4]
MRQEAIPLDTGAAVRETTLRSPSLGLVLRSLAVHFTVWILVAVFGTICILLSAFTRGQIVFWLGRLWGIIILKVAGVTVEVHGLERFPAGEPHVLVGNHTSNFDIYAMIPALGSRYYRFLAKREVLYLPIFGWALWAGGFPLVDRRNNAKARRTMKKLAERMKRTGLSLLAFPEGTRNHTDQLLMRFKKGPFIVAAEVGVPILPFVLHGARQIQGRHEYLVHPGTITVEFLEPISVSGRTYKDRDDLLLKARTAIETALLRGPRKESAEC